MAVCGKGGVGKTTFSAITARALFRAKYFRALLVDADHAGGLALALGLSPEKTVNDLRLRIIEQIKNRTEDRRDLAASVDFRLMEALVEKGNLGFLSMGRPVEEGCYCTTHTLLREAIEALSGRFDLTVIDAEAGIEQINRKVIGAVDTLVLVSDTSKKGMAVARALYETAHLILAPKKTALVLNRVKNPEQAAKSVHEFNLPLMGMIPEDEVVTEFDEQGLPYFDLPDCPGSRAVEMVLKNLGVLAD